MRRLQVLSCFVAFMMFASSVCAAGLVKHISGGGTNTANGTAFKAALTSVLAGYPTTDTLMIDDSSTYDLGTSTSGMSPISKPIKIVAASGTAPIIYFKGGTNTTQWFVSIGFPGVQIGSSAAGEDGRITFDGGNNIGRFIGLSTSVIWPTTATATTTIENIVIQGVNDGRNTGAKYFWAISAGGWSTASPMNGGNVINIRNVEFKLPATQPMIAGQKVGALTLGPDNGATFNIENCRSNGSRGYIVDIGSGAAQYPQAGGTVNIKNCSFYQDQFTTSPLVQAPIQTGGWDPRNGGYDINIDNCFIRTDALHATQIAAWTRTSETSNSTGCITLNACSKNNLTVTNSALVGMGAVLALETTSSQIRVTNSDLYVNGVTTASDGTPTGYVTPGYFVNISPRVAYLGNHQTTMTRCNLYGLAGSNLQNSIMPSTDRWVMVNCNDWSPVNAYAPGWITTGCQNPGLNPGYGLPAGGSDVQPGIDARDFTVYNQTIKAANIGSDRAFNMGVPVELSAFQVN
ncbi:hypothetical protein LLG95_10160 [bacterium]|nr:hypothetical protein [bacterium]